MKNQDFQIVSGFSKSGYIYCITHSYYIQPLSLVIDRLPLTNSLPFWLGIYLWQNSSDLGLMYGVYYIAQILTGGNFDIFDAFQLDSQNLIHQIIKNNTVFTGVWWKAGTIRQNIFRQLFEELVSVKISPSKFCAIGYLSNTPTSHGLYTTYNIYFGLGFCDVIFILICSYMTAEENFWKVT